MLAGKFTAAFTIFIALELFLEGVSGAKDVSDESVEKNSTGRGRRPNRWYSKSKSYFYDNCRDKSYNIQEVSDLLKKRSELDCIFRRGAAPATVPEGSYRGTILQVIRTDWFNPFVSFMWNGKQVVKTSCHGKQSYIGWTNVANSPSFPFTVRIGPLDEELGHGEHEDDRDSVVMDYSKNFAKVCPEFKSISSYRQKMDNLGGIHNVINVMRIVGEKRDGSTIYLGKSYMRVGVGEDKRVHNLAHFAVVNYDPNITPPNSYPSAESYEEPQKRRSMANAAPAAPATP